MASYCRLEDGSWKQCPHWSPMQWWQIILWSHAPPTECIYKYVLSSYGKIVWCFNGCNYSLHIDSITNMLLSFSYCCHWPEYHNYSPMMCTLMYKILSCWLEVKVSGLPRVFQGEPLVSQHYGNLNWLKLKQDVATNTEPNILYANCMLL